MKMEEIFNDLPTIETPRLRLRKLTLKDAENMFSYCSNEEVAKYVTWDRHETIDNTIDFIMFVLEQYQSKKIAPWAIEVKETNEMVGTIDFVSWSTHHHHAEIGYALSQQYWGKGMIPEAATALLTFGFENMNLERIEARCFVENTASAKVMEKIGMTREGTMKKKMFTKGKFWDVNCYAILREDFYIL